jgi:hypothetical protein
MLRAAIICTGFGPHVFAVFYSVGELNCILDSVRVLIVMSLVDMNPAMGVCRQT